MPFKLLAACLLAAAPAASAGDVVLRAMSDELQRSVKDLKLAALDRPYFLSYYVLDSSETQVSASFGSLREDRAFFSRTASADLRVGDASFDSSGYAGQDFQGYRPGAEGLPEEDAYGALRFSLWALTDEAYKRALEAYSGKKAYAQKKTIAELYGDLSAEKAQQYYADRPAGAACDAAAWREKTKKLSAVFRRYPGVQGSQVSFTCALRTVRFANSEGARSRWWWDKVDLEIRAAVQDRTGLRIGDEKKLAWRSPAEVPPYEELERETEEFAAAMSALVAPSSVAVYLGPVLFEDQAAAEFLNQLFVRNISFARVPWADRDEWTHYYIDSGELTKKLGMRVLPAFMQAYDDPTVASYGGRLLTGSYPADNEGQRPAKLELVKNGRLAAFYMSRAPVKEFRQSNGHGRAFPNEFATPRPGSVFFAAAQEKRRPKAELKRELLRAAAESGLDYALLVRRLDTEDKKKTEDLLAGPVLAYKVSVKDGSETPLGGAEWAGVTFRALRDIMLVSDADYIYNYYQAGPFLYNRGYVPASIVAPDALLVQELELKPADAKPDRQPYLPHPFFSGAAR